MSFKLQKKDKVWRVDVINGVRHERYALFNSFNDALIWIDAVKNGKLNIKNAENHIKLALQWIRCITKLYGIKHLSMSVIEDSISAFSLAEDEEGDGISGAYVVNIFEDGVEE